MQFMVTSQDRPQNSPLYAISASLDSFIMFNDEALTEQIISTESMAETEEEEHNVVQIGRASCRERVSSPV